ARTAHTKCRNEVKDLQRSVKLCGRAVADNENEAGKPFNKYNPSRNRLSLRAPDKCSQYTYAKAIVRNSHIQLSRDGRRCCWERPLGSWLNTRQAPLPSTLEGQSIH